MSDGSRWEIGSVFFPVSAAGSPDRWLGPQLDRRYEIAPGTNRVPLFISPSHLALTVLSMVPPAAWLLRSHPQRLPYWLRVLQKCF